MKTMKFVLLIVAIMSANVALSSQQQRADDKQDLVTLVKNLEKQNSEMRFQLRVFENELKHSQTIQTRTIDSLMQVMQETQMKVIQTSDTLSKTYLEISTVKSKSDAQGEWFGSSLYRNRIQMFVAFLILLIFFSILYYFLNKSLTKNAILVQNKFQAAYEDFDDNIKTASALLNKHIKETREGLDAEVRHTQKELDKQIAETKDELNKQIEQTSLIMDTKIEDNKKVLDAHVENTKKGLSSEIENASARFEKQLKDLKDAFDEHIRQRYDTICSEFSERTDNLTAGIQELKKEITQLKEK